MENINVGQGLSDHDDPYEAGKTAAEEAMEDYTGEEKPDIGFVFCSGTKYGTDRKNAESFSEGVQEVLDEIHWIGCNSAGEISRDGFKQGTAVVTLIGSDMVYWGSNVEKIDSENPEKTGEKGAEKALDNMNIDRMVHSYSQYQFLKEADTSQMISSDPYNMLVIANGPDVENKGFDVPIKLLKGIKKVVSSNPIIGGLSSHESAEQSYQFFNGEVYENALITVSIVTTLKTSFRLANGYQTTSKAVLTTETDGSVVGKFNGEDAAQKYAELIEKDFSDLLPKSQKIAKKLNLEKGLLKMMKAAGKNPVKENPLTKIASRNPLGFVDKSGDVWIKMPVDIKDGKKLQFMNDVPKNSALQVLKFDIDSVYKTSTDAIEELKEEINNRGFIFAFECYQRLNLFEEKLEDISEEYTLGGDIIPLGFATMGEFGTTKEGVSGGQAITLTTMGISDKALTDSGK